MPLVLIPVEDGERILVDRGKNQSVIQAQQDQSILVGALDLEYALRMFPSWVKISRPFQTCINWLLDVGHVGRSQTLDEVALRS